jgi:hypothetical protein
MGMANPGKRGESGKSEADTAQDGALGSTTRLEACATIAGNVCYYRWKRVLPLLETCATIAGSVCYRCRISTLL